jgi:hypothetical protein
MIKFMDLNIDFENTSEQHEVKLPTTSGASVATTISDRNEKLECRVTEQAAELKQNENEFGALRRQLTGVSRARGLERTVPDNKRSRSRRYVQTRHWWQN